MNESSLLLDYEEPPTGAADYDESTVGADQDASSDMASQSEGKIVIMVIVGILVVGMIVGLVFWVVFRYFKDESEEAPIPSSDNAPPQQSNMQIITPPDSTFIKVVCADGVLAWDNYINARRVLPLW